MTFLGVDGGGTKTAFCLVAADGTVRARIRTRSLDWLSRGPEHVEAVLAEGIPAVCAAAGTEPAGLSFAFFGIPAYGEVGGALAALDAAPRAPLGHDRYACDNDMVCGWAGSLAGADGINVIAGTGSMTYGERAGRGVRVGGWGELFGDEGSAYWIAVRGLQAFSRMSDGRAPRGPLHARLRDALGLERDLDLVDVVLNRWAGGRGEIAGVAPHVSAAAGDGDEAARAILAAAAAELARLVSATREQLGFGPEEPVTVSHSGGVFAAGPDLLPFREALAASDGSYDLREPRFPPDAGAALHAARLGGAPLGDAALRRLADDLSRRDPEEHP